MIHRRWIVLLVLGALLAHIIEVSVFAGGYYLLDKFESCGGLLDSGGNESTDYWYFSFVVYTSLGFGENHESTRKITVSHVQAENPKMGPFNPAVGRTQGNFV